MPSSKEAKKNDLVTNTAVVTALFSTAALAVQVATKGRVLAPALAQMASTAVLAYKSGKR
ncbi:MAG: hypothetical protein EBZ47_08915 [Chlamydiae bacterium]|nr:hypothetical protein [Chlamydiota bacterium]